ncbi:MAG: cytochrome c biogenesis protein CcsA [Planctomycetota bacterium]
MTLFIFTVCPLLILISYALLFDLAMQSLSTADLILDRWTTRVESGIVLLQGSWLLLLSLEQDQIPVITMGQGFSLASWVMLLSLACAHLRVQRGVLAIFIYGIALLLFFLGLYSGIPYENVSIPTYGWIFALHTLLILIGCSFCFLMGLFGMTYLALKRDLKKKKFGILYRHLPPLNILARMDNIASWCSLIFFSTGMLFGSLLNYQRYQAYWILNRKGIISLVVWSFLGINILSRTVLKKQGRLPAQLSFFCGLLLFMGVLILTFSY